MLVPLESAGIAGGPDPVSAISRSNVAHTEAASHPAIVNVCHCGILYKGFIQSWTTSASMLA